MCRRAADTEEEAEARAEVLAKAGVVLRFNGMVYLRPQEVSELVYRVSTSSTAAGSKVVGAAPHSLSTPRLQSHAGVRGEPSDPTTLQLPARCLLLPCLLRPRQRHVQDSNTAVSTMTSNWQESCLSAHRSVLALLFTWPLLSLCAVCR